MNTVRRTATRCLVGIIALTALTLACFRLQLDLATAGFLYMIVIVLLSLAGDVISSISNSIVAAVCLDYFFAPPVLSFRVDNPVNVLAIVVFLTTSLVIARLVSRLRTMSEEALSSVNRKLIDAEERLRSQIGQNLDADIAQRLALICNELTRIGQDLQGKVDNMPGSIRALGLETSKVAADVVNLSHELRSHKIEYLGVEKVMRKFCREFGEEQGTEIDFKSHNLPDPLPMGLSLSLFQVLSEALNNSAKHSRSQHVEVELFGTSQAIHLTVRDSGVGFDAEAASEGAGLGLIVMRERLKLVNGRFSIDSQPKAGTTIHACVPLPDQSTKEAQTELELPEKKVL